MLCYYCVRVINYIGRDAVGVVITPRPAGEGGRGGGVPPTGGAGGGLRAGGV